MIYAENILICLVSPIVVLLLFLKGKEKRFCVSLLIGMIVCLLSAYVNSYMTYIHQLGTEDAAKYITPFIEEGMKLLPAVMYLLLFRPEVEELMVFSAALAVGFATFENCCYITSNGAEQLGFVMVRGLSAGVIHILCGMMMGSGIAYIRKYPDLLIQGILGVLTLTTTIHALYNLMVSAGAAARNTAFAIPICAVLMIFFCRTYITGVRKKSDS